MATEKKSTINEVAIFSFSDIIDRLTDLSESWKGKDSGDDLILWFRGQASSKWSLIPNIYRLHSTEPDVDLENEQKRGIFEFMNRKRHLIHKIQTAPNMLPDDNQLYLWLSIMQHYQHPTCLLDFSEKLIPSLMFAIKRYIFDDSSYVKSPPCVWILNPLRMNQITLKNKFTKLFKAGSMKFIPSIEQLTNPDGFMSDRVAIFSPLITDRILAQSGTFVAFPLSFQESNKPANLEDRSLDKHVEAGSFLEKWVISDPDKLAMEIKLMGFNYEDLFPGL